MSESYPKILKYVERADVSQTFEDEALNALEENDLIILGLPGVGKSASAKAIAAKYIIKNNPSVVVSINRTIQKFEHHAEIIEVNDNAVPVSVISVPFKSTNSSELLAMIVDSMSKLARTLESILKYEGIANITLDKMDLANKIKDLIFDILHQTPNDIGEILEVGKILSEAIPYVTTALRITSLVVKQRQEYKLFCSLTRLSNCFSVSLWPDLILMVISVLPPSHLYLFQRNYRIHPSNLL